MKESDEIKLPLATLRRREVDARLEKYALECNWSPVVARVLAGRPLTTERGLSCQLAPTLTDLDSEQSLADIDLAAERLAGAILSQEVIGIATDYDMDGLGGHAAFRLAVVHMLGHPPHRLRSYIGHRLAEGYGLTQSMAERVMADSPKPTLLVTADTGSSDEPRIAQLSTAGIDVIVTDHHDFPSGGPPRSAYACVNPQRTDCNYPDKSIAGGMVLWLLLRAVRRVLIQVGHAAAHSARLEELLDFVGCSTVADCVSLASRNNRAVVSAALDRMNELRRPCWQAVAQCLKVSIFRSESIAFGIAPRVNARTRLSDPFAALHFLLARDLPSALTSLRTLELENTARKAIEREMIDDAMRRAARQVSSGRCSITLTLPDGHPGVQGICSARLVETFGCPVFLFSPKDTRGEVLTGSARTIDAINVKQLLMKVDAEAPGLIQRFGGHKAAAGAQIRACDFDIFQELFESATRAVASRESLGPVRWSDGELHRRDATFRLLDELGNLEPTGKGFEPAMFDATFRVLAIRVIGDGTHLRVELHQEGERVDAVWFRARRAPSDPLPIAVGDNAHLLYALADNHFRGNRHLQLRISARVSAPTVTTTVALAAQADRSAPARPSGMRAQRRSRAPRWLKG